MKITMSKLSFVLSFFVAIHLSAAEPVSEKSITQGVKKTVKLLAIGNSFSGNATKYLAKIVNDNVSCELVFAHAMIGGCPLEKHYSLAMKNENNPDDPQGKPYSFKGGKASLKDMLTAEKWQYVTIQQYSAHCFKIGTYRPSAGDLVAYIKKHAPDAEIVFHQTWAYREDDKSMFKDGFTQKSMYQELTKAYYTIADETGIKRVIPVGDAFQLVSESPEWKFETDKNFNYKDPKYPELPDQAHSLNVGYFWKGDGETKKLTIDTHHANSMGEYLGGCVWFEFFYGEDARKIKFKPDQMDEKDAKFLKDITHRVVSEGIKPSAWPLGK